MDNKIFYMPEHLQLFLYLVLKANHKKGSCYGIALNRGQLITGRKILSAELRTNEGTAYKRLKWLQQNSLISLKSNNKFTIVTICNYDTYNLLVTTSGQQGNNKVTSKEQQGNTNNNNKNDKNKKNEKKELSPFDIALNDFEEMRKKIRAPLTEKAKKLILNKLSKLSSNEETQIKILEQSTMNSWKGVFELKVNESTEKKWIV